MINRLIKLILIFLLVSTPIALGSMEVWAFSLMELGILLVIILWAIQMMIPQSTIPNPQSAFRSPHSTFIIPLLFLFLLLVLFQMIPLPSGIIRIISPKTYALHQSLSLEPSALSLQLSFLPFATRIEFFKWLTLSGLFVFLLLWKPLDRSHQVPNQLMGVIMFIGIAESLYGMFEFFSGHRHILYLDDLSFVSSVTGTFVNRNYFAGYLLMVIPLSVGYLFSREGFQRGRFMGWRHRLSSIDGKTLLIAFGIIVMIVALLFSASRMGIISLLLSFSLISLLFRNPQREKGFSKTSVLIFGLAVLWAAWIGLDAVISRFFSVSESFGERWKIWVNTFQVFRDFPLFGSGLGTFAQIFPMYRSFYIDVFHTHAENDFLQLASEAGLIGIALLSILFFFLFYKAVSGLHSLSHRDLQKYVGIGGLVGILALMFHSIVERNIQVPANAFLFTLIFALILRISSVKKHGREM